MAILYRFEEKADNINPKNAKKKGLYPIVQNKKTIHTNDLAKGIASQTNIGESTARILIEAMVDTIETELKNGNSVCINGFGTFSLSAKSKNVLVDSEIRAESISVKKVGFRCSPPFLRRFKFAKFKKINKAE